MILFEKYFSHSDRRIELALKNGQLLRGMIAGFFFSDNDPAKRSIHLWRFVEENESGNQGYHGVMFVKGTMIRHKDIIRVTFLEDNSTLTIQEV